MLYVDYDKFMSDLQVELDITLPEYIRHSGYFDEKNFISCNRKNDELIFMEIAIKHDEDYSKNAVNLKIPFEVINKQVALNYSINNTQILDGINKVNDYLPVYHSIEIAGKTNTELLEIYYTSYLLISADLIVTTDDHHDPLYILEDIHFDFEIQYRTYGNYNRKSVQHIFRTVDEKLMKVFSDESIDYEKISMDERVRIYNIVQKLMLS